MQNHKFQIHSQTSMVTSQLSLTLDAYGSSLTIQVLCIVTYDKINISTSHLLATLSQLVWLQIKEVCLSLARGSSTVVEHSTHDPKIKGSNPTTGSGSDNSKNSSYLIKRNILKLNVYISGSLFGAARLAPKSLDKDEIF